ncbi:hypothetical protein [Planctomicrobium piriforme]|uniref:Uncharacterized protein n=1 Tax=Planctomicrobium piriforme TaxID=1576369 RepID=A0A1I3FEU2_9PLAN|nr:hypothetical protein [Planctomicrobium piriforme]SFI09451.1 hypothetical protein SAMN05421753_105201 [Planctomicrobium piriforme]
MNIGRLRFPKLTRLEWVVVVVIIAILIALLVPQTKWVSSGTLRLPVRVIAFNSKDATPIAGADVTIFRAPPVFDLNSLREDFDRYHIDPDLKGYSGTISTVDQGFTDADGVVVIEYEFRTGASHVRPAPYAHTNFAWIQIQANGYGTVVVPVRHESMPTKILKERGELIVPVGMGRPAD